jgi:hypothetical protein
MAFLRYIQRPIYAIAPTIVFAQIASYIQVGQADLFMQLFSFYIVYIVISQIVGWLFAYSGQGYTVVGPYIWIYLYRKYYTSYLRADNTAIEKIGTGKMISIFQA